MSGFEFEAPLDICFSSQSTGYGPVSSQSSVPGPEMIPGMVIIPQIHDVDDLVRAIGRVVSIALRNIQQRNKIVKFLCNSPYLLWQLTCYITTALLCSALLFSALPPDLPGALGYKELFLHLHLHLAKACGPQRPRVLSESRKLLCILILTLTLIPSPLRS